MKKALSAFLFLIFALVPHVAVAQQTALAIVVQSCGTAPYTYVKGQRQPVVQDVNGNVCTTAAVTASISGFQTTSYGTPISATTGGATGSLPSNAGEFVAQNVGTFGAFCKTGASVNTAGQYLSPNGGWFAYAVTSETQITCEGVGGTTTVNLFGGTGLPTGTGGGGGSGGTTWPADEASFTYGTTAFTPIGGVYNSSITALTSGQSGAAALTANRDLHIDAVAGTNLANLMAAAVPGYYATAYNTCSQVTGTTAPICVDLNGNMYANISRYFGTVASPNASIMTVQPAGGDPCQTLAKTYTPINYSASGLNTTPLVAGTSGKKTIVCQIVLNNNAADSIGIIETTTGTSCATDVQALWGGATHSSASAGFNFAATAGIALGNGSATIATTKTANDDICFIQSAATQTTGGIVTVQQ